MKKRAYALLFCYLACSAAALAGDGWTGLWRVNRYYDGKLDGSYHIFLESSTASQLQVTAYTNDARPMIEQRFEFSGDELTLQVANSVKQPLPLLFELTRDGDRVSGKWTFSQMQLMAPLEGEAVGFRITGSSEWEPWPFLPELQESGRTWVDLAGEVLDNAPWDGFEAFLAFWDRQVGPRYYFLLQDALYGDARQREERLKLLRPVFEQLRESGPEREIVEEFPAIAARVKEAVDTRDNSATTAFLVNWPFLPASEAHRESMLWTRIPTPAEEASCACQLDLRERFLVTDGLAFTGGEHPGQAWEEALLREVLWTRPAPSVGIEVFRRGVARLLALEGRGQALPEPESGERESLQQQVRSVLLEPLAAAPEEVARQTAPLVDFGARLAHYVKEELSLQELLRRGDREVLRDWREFLHQSGP